MNRIISNMRKFFNKESAEKGQMIAYAPFLIIAIAALVGLVFDMSMWAWLNIDANTQASRACIAAAEANRIGQDPQLAFQDILQKNGYTQDRYDPKQGTGLGLTRGLEEYGNTWISAVSWRETTSFLRIVGIDSFPVLGQSRCIGREGGGLAPIAVRESAAKGSLQGEKPEEYTILGNDPKWDLADIESGTNFAGSVFLHMWCIPAGDPNCPNIKYFYPLTEAPPSAQTQKKLVLDCFMGINCSIWPDAGERLPIVSGTSNKQLCKAFQDGGWQVGDKVLVIIFDGEVYSPDPTYGNWENVAVTGYAVYEITSFEPNPNNCNHVKAKLASPKIYTSLNEIPATVLILKSREIQWDYQGGLQ